MNRTCTMPECERKHVARGYCSTHYNSEYAPEKWHAKVEMPCAVCSSPVLRRIENHTRYRATCSSECRSVVQWGHASSQQQDYDWTKMAEKRAQKAGAAIIDYVDRVAVFERDDWTCYLCQQVVSLDVDCYEPLAATVDHVVPFSKGGQHALSNVATCCFMCNSTKQASLNVTL